MAELHIAMLSGSVIRWHVFVAVAVAVAALSAAAAAAAAASSL